MPLSNLNGIAPSLDSANCDPLRDTKYDFPRDTIGFGRKSFNPKWPAGSKIAISFVINYEEVGRGFCNSTSFNNRQGC